MLLYADAYIARGEDVDASVILQTIIDGKPKQEYLDEANKRLAILKQKQEQKQKELENQNQPTELKIEYNQSKGDSALFSEPEKPKE